MNMLDPKGGPPPAPNPQPAPQGGQGTGAPGGTPQQQQPAPNHKQTVATLLHLHAFEQMYRGLMSIPELGRSSVKSQVIDGTTKLVAERFINAGQAVALLGGFPDEPPEQRKWIAQHLMRDRQAELMLLSHHSAGSLEGIGMDETPPSGRPDDHLDMMGGMHAMYGKR